MGIAALVRGTLTGMLVRPSGVLAGLGLPCLWIVLFTLVPSGIGFDTSMFEALNNEFAFVCVLVGVVLAAGSSERLAWMARGVEPTARLAAELIALVSGGLVLAVIGESPALVFAGTNGAPPLVVTALVLVGPLLISSAAGVFLLRVCPGVGWTPWVLAAVLVLLGPAVEGDAGSALAHGCAASGLLFAAWLMLQRPLRAA